MIHPMLTLSLVGVLAVCGYAQAPNPDAPTTPPADAAATAPSPEEQAVRTQSAALVDALNRGQADAVAALFLPDGELVDEAGTVYHGRDEIAALLGRFFERYTGATTAQDVELVRTLGPDLAVEDGTRTVTASGGASAARSRYIIVWSRRDGRWQVASLRQYDEELPTPHDRLQPLAWMIGEWVEDGPGSRVVASCRWSDDGNYLLRNFTVTVAGQTVMDTDQRIGWDPLAQKIRAWAFDSDGGRAESDWTAIEGRWIVKATAVLPDGTTGSATIVYEPIDADSFRMRGLDRILGDTYEPDFEATIVRKPPAPTIDDDPAQSTSTEDSP